MNGSDTEGAVVGPGCCPTATPCAHRPRLGAIHGLVTLELDDQLGWTGLDVAQLVRAEADDLASDLGMGLTAPAGRARRR